MIDCFHPFGMEKLNSLWWAEADMQIMKVKQFKLVNQPVTLHLSHNDISIELRVVTDKDHLCSVDDKCLNVSSQYNKYKLLCFYCLCW